MKTKNLIASLAALIIAVAFTGCDKNKTPATQETNTPPATPATAPATADTNPVVAEAVAAATNAVSAATAKADGIIAQAKSFIAEKKYTEALDTLNKLSGAVLTPEQQKTVADLKAQLQKLMSSGTDAVDAAKSLLGK